MQPADSQPHYQIDAIPTQGDWIPLKSPMTVERLIDLLSKVDKTLPVFVYDHDTYNIHELIEKPSASYPNNEGKLVDLSAVTILDDKLIICSDGY